MRDRLKRTNEDNCLILIELPAVHVEWKLLAYITYNFKNHE